jgi:hypothetical protein
VAPVLPVFPLGTVKLNIPDVEVPELVTDAFVPAAPVVVVPTTTVADSPLEPAGPWAPVLPVFPLGTVKLNTAAVEVPELVTDAFVPAAPVVVVPTATVAPLPEAPDIKPFASRNTIVFGVLAVVAVVAELETLPAVDIVASLVSAIAAAELMSALTIESAVIAVGMVIFAEPSNACAVPVTSPDTFTVRAVASLVAVPALPLTDPVTLPVTFPLKVPVIVPAEKFPLASR